MALVVNGQRIEDEAIEQEAERMRPEYEEAFAEDDPEPREARLQEWARENVVERLLLEQEARNDPRPVTASDIGDALDEMKQQCGDEQTLYEQFGLAEPDEAAVRQLIELRLRVSRVLDDLCKDLPAPADDAVQRYYDEHRAELVAPEQVRAAHIVKHVDASVGPEEAKAELDKVREELGKGADFAEMARQHSDCPENGGDLGYFARGQMVEEFEHIAFSMCIDSVSEVFASRFGFHIVKILDRKLPEPYPLDELHEHIAERLANEIRSDAIETHLNELRAKATVEEA